MIVRDIFDAATVQTLRPFSVDVVACAGYMRKITSALLNAYTCVNVHPADLSVVRDGKRDYTGSKAVRKAILAGAHELRASTHVLTEKLDGGPLLMVSSPLLVGIPAGLDMNNSVIVDEVASHHQRCLKRVGDWVIFPKTLEYIADGKYAQDEDGNLYFEDKPIPQGLRL